MSTIQDRLRIFMHFKKLNATQLSEIIDVQRSSISHVLNGRNKPSLEFVQRLVKEFPEVSFEWLVNGSGSLTKTGTNVTPPSTTQTDDVVTNVTQEDTSTTTLAGSVRKDDAGQVSEPVNKPIQEPDKESVSPIKKIVVFYQNGTFEEYFPR